MLNYVKETDHFNLLYNSVSCKLNRNFCLQRVGTIDWLQKNCDFSRIAFYVYELIVLDLTRFGLNIHRFSESLKILAKGCFAPISTGCGIRMLSNARQLLRSEG